MQRRKGQCEGRREEHLLEEKATSGEGRLRFLAQFLNKGKSGKELQFHAGLGCHETWDLWGNGPQGVSWEQK